MRILFDFECNACAEVFEELVTRAESLEVKCPRCTGATTRLIGAPTIDPNLGLDAASFPTMGDKWARVRRQRKLIESKRESD